MLQKDGRPEQLRPETAKAKKKMKEPVRQDTSEHVKAAAPAHHRILSSTDVNINNVNSTSNTNG